MTVAEEMRLLNTVNEFFNVNLNQKLRKRELVDIKHAFRYVMRDMGYSLADVGRMMGCNHATVIHSYKQAKALMEVEQEFANMVSIMRSIISDFHVSYRIKTRKLEMNREKSMISVFCVLLNEVREYVGEDGLDYWLSRAQLEPKQFENIVFAESILEEA